MSKLQSMIQELVDAGRNPTATIRASLAESKKPAVGCFPLFLPEELIYAAGYLPIGLWGGISRFSKADKYLQSFACSIMRANMELTLRGDYDFLRAILIPTQCDTLKCVGENMKICQSTVPIIGVTIPHNRGIQAAQQQLLCEFDYISDQLAALKDPAAQPCSLDEAMAVYEDYRKTMCAFTATVPAYLQSISPSVRHHLIKAAYFMDKRVYTAKMRALLAELKAQPTEHFAGTKLVVTGILLDSEPVLDLFAELGIAVVDDMLCHESLQFNVPPSDSGSASLRLARRLLDLQAASVLYEPGKPRGNLLAALAKKHDAAAVLFVLLKFCDPEAFDQPLVAQDLKAQGVKMLSVEIDQLPDSIEQLRTRLQAFLEMNG